MSAQDGSDNSEGDSLRRSITALAQTLRTETVGGVLLLVAVAAALVFANTALADFYRRASAFELGPSRLHLHLSLQAWSADGLLAIFFFVAGLELKREFTVGDLRDTRRAVVPVAAAVGGVVVPALVFLSIVRGHEPLRHGWAIPTATDIAFALAVLAVVGGHLVGAVRTFLLTLAVVDDLIAITIIAVVYSERVSITLLLCSLLGLVAFALLMNSPWAMRPPVIVLELVIALTVWTLVHASGVHATVAGVLLALTVPTRPRADEERSREERIDHAIRPLSAAVAVPLFAFFASGLAFSGVGGALREPAGYAVAIALVVGKCVGVFSGAWLAVQLSGARLDPSLRWRDILGISLLAGIGFTVSLLIAELAFGLNSPEDQAAKVGVFTGSVVAAILGTVTVRLWGTRADLDGSVSRAR